MLKLMSSVCIAIPVLCGSTSAQQAGGAPYNASLFLQYCGGGSAHYATTSSYYTMDPTTGIVNYTFWVFLSAGTRISPNGSCTGVALPVNSAATSNSTSAGGCSVFYSWGITLDTGYTTLVGNIGPNDNALYLYEMGPSQPANNLPTTAFAAGAGVAGVCTYFSR